MLAAAASRLQSGGGLRELTLNLGQFFLRTGQVKSQAIDLLCLRGKFCEQCSATIFAFLYLHLCTAGYLRTRISLQTG